ncbi:hypothetical protein HWV62_37655 [Athelia sp. TMB]|nr:hypothetical protein HWV62_37655 [Athelia sp. TMB]
MKVEPDDDGFVQDVSHQTGSPPPAPFEHLVPLTEVPLRATGVTKDMRKLMGVFRLNPFSINRDGRRGASNSLWNGQEPGPLTEQPQLIEYQLDGYHDSEEGDGSHGGSPRTSLHLSDGDEGSASPSIKSDGDSELSSGWQAAYWGLQAFYPSPSNGPSLYFDYTGATSASIPSAELAYRDVRPYYSDSHHSHQDAPSSCSPVDSHSPQPFECASSSTHSLPPSSQPFQQRITDTRSIAEYDLHTLLRRVKDSHGHPLPYGSHGHPSHVHSLPLSLEDHRADVQHIWEPKPVYPSGRSTRDQTIAYCSAFGGPELHILSG